MLETREPLSRRFVLRCCPWREYEPVSCIRTWSRPPGHPAAAREALGPDAVRSRRRATPLTVGPLRGRE
jgi:hypothetical protein